jgi:uncharacterized protein (TIGR03382 family)
MRILLISAVVLFSSAAFGQAVQVQIQSATGTDTLSVGPAQCDESRTFNWRVSGTACGDLTLWITRDTDCKESASAQSAGSTRELSSIPQATVRSGTGTSNFQVSALPIFSSGDGGVTCGASGISETLRLCGATKQSSDMFGTCGTTTVVKATAPLKITYDTQAPGAPIIEAVNPLDKSLQVQVTAPDDASEVRLVVSRDGTLITSVRQGVDQSRITVKNLQNGVTYQLAAYAIDAAGNESTDAATAEGIPIKTLGFYEKYREANGAETGGCGATGGGMAGGALLSVLGFWLFSRRKRS